MPVDAIYVTLHDEIRRNAEYIERVIDLSRQHAHRVIPAVMQVIQVWMDPAMLKNPKKTEVMVI